MRGVLAADVQQRAARGGADGHGADGDVVRGQELVLECERLVEQRVVGRRYMRFVPSAPGRAQRQQRR